MLLRKFIKHVKTENWFAVFLDFLVVVIGIFVALQVASWSNEKEEKESTKQALKSAISETKFNIKTSKLMIEDLQKDVIYIEEAFDNLLDCKKVEQNQVTMEHSFELLTNAFLIPWNVNNTNILNQLIYSKNYSEKFKVELSLYLVRQNLLTKNTTENGRRSAENSIQNNELIFIKKTKKDHTSFREKYILTSEFEDFCNSKKAIKSYWASHNSRLENIAAYKQRKEFAKLFLAAMNIELETLDN